MTEATIAHAPFPIGGIRGKWYAYRPMTPDELSSAQDGDDCLYLHVDGVWRETTLHNGVYTGYFPSREAAAECLERHHLAAAERAEKESDHAE